jgi:cysteinyl-tRNA synthetase
MSLEWVRSWGYQLQNLTSSDAVNALAQSSYDLLVLDPTDTVAGDESFNAAQMVAQLHASSGEAGRPKEVVAYIDVGEAENYRTYWQSA